MRWFRWLRAPLPRGIGLLWVLSLAFAGGRLHECGAGHAHAAPEAAATDAAHSHHHTAHEPATTPIPQAPCDCLGQCCPPLLLALPTPSVAATVLTLPTPSAGAPRPAVEHRPSRTAFLLPFPTAPPAIA